MYDWCVAYSEAMGCDMDAAYDEYRQEHNPIMEKPDGYDDDWKYDGMYL